MPRTLFKRLKTIDMLIQKKSTGNAAALALQLGVSERSVKDFITIMKELGAPIYFNRQLNSYCYSCKGGFVVHFERQ
jgi:predicted DNA-binding transcriptional regulator YafY